MIDEDEARALLMARRAELDRQDEISAEDRAPVTLDQESVGRLSRVDALQRQAMAMANQRRRQIERNSIGEALRRLDEGEFGYCVQCGEEISEARLRHNPGAAQCIECAGST